MKGHTLAFLTLSVVGLIGAAVWLRATRFERYASTDVRKFAESGSPKLYTYYPHIINRIAADPVLAPRVELVSLSVGDFKDVMYDGRDFSALSELPNLHTLQVTYAHNTDSFMPIVNSISTLRSAMFAYCSPRESWMESLDSSSLRHLQIHDYHAEAIPKQVLESLSKRMPQCKIEITSD